MLRTALVLTLALPCVLLAGEKPAAPPMPKSVVLTQGTAKLEGEILRCQVTIMQYREEQRFETVIQAGQAVTQAVTVKVPYYVAVQQIVPLKGLQGYHVTGKGGDPTKAFEAVDAAKLPKLFEQNRPIAFTPPGEKVTADTVKGLKEGTIVLVQPKPEPPPPPKK